eukprot:758061-Hanusia_phi.AAC.1
MILPNFRSEVEFGKLLKCRHRRRHCAGAAPGTVTVARARTAGSSTRRSDCSLCPSDQRSEAAV